MRSFPLILALAALAAVLAASAGARTSVSATLAYVSFGEDKVGVGGSAVPGGGPDAHFTLTVDAPGETVVVIELASANADGTLCCGAHWDTVPKGWWILGVFRGGTMLNAGDSGISDPIASSAVYELYAQNTGLFKDGQSFRVDVTFASGAATALVMTIGTPGSRSVTPTAPAKPPATSTPTPTTPTPTTPAPTTSTPATPAPAARPAVSLGASARRPRPRRCVVLKAKSTAAPAGARIVLERRAGRAWVAIRAARVCSARAGAVTYRATLKRGTRIVARSKPLTIVWKA